jgi:hypothetical protein
MFMPKLRTNGKFIGGSKIDNQFLQGHMNILLGEHKLLERRYFQTKIITFIILPT